MLKNMSCVFLMVSSVAFGQASAREIARAPHAFSADLVVTKAGDQARSQRGRVYVLQDKVRIETPEFAGNFFIVDGEREAAWYVRPRQWIFMDAKQSSLLTRVFVAVEPSDPCREWQVMESVAGVEDTAGEWRCDRVGRDTVDGRAALKYSVMSRQNRRSYRWIDPEHRFPIRLETEDGTVVAVQHIVDAPQPVTLFAIPAVYKKFDPLQLIQQLMDSDVMVKPPK